MFPLLQVGDEVLLDVRVYRQHQPQIGDIVVAHHPTQAGLKVVKRVTAVHPTTNTFYLQGDNRGQSTDFDHVPLTQIIGRVTSRFG